MIKPGWLHACMRSLWQNWRTPQVSSAVVSFSSLRTFSALYLASKYLKRNFRFLNLIKIWRKNKILGNRGAPENFLWGIFVQLEELGTGDADHEWECDGQACEVDHDESPNHNHVFVSVGFIFVFILYAENNSTNDCLQNDANNSRQSVSGRNHSANFVVDLGKDGSET